MQSNKLDVLIYFDILADRSAYLTGSRKKSIFALINT